MAWKTGLAHNCALEEAERDVAFWCRYVLEREFTTREEWELQNLLTVARLMIGAAKEREESRGVHYRSDFPGRDDAKWVRHLARRLVEASARPAKPIPQDAVSAPEVVQE